MTRLTGLYFSLMEILRKSGALVLFAGYIALGLILIYVVGSVTLGRILLGMGAVVLILYFVFKFRH